MLLEVSQDIYAEFYRDKERERYLRKLDRENKLFSLEALKRDGDGAADISLSFSVDIVEKVISDLLLDRLRECMESAKNNRLIPINPCFEINVPWENRQIKRRILTGRFHSLGKQRKCICPSRRK